MIIHTMPQRTPSWFKVRCGHITGTSFQTMANGRKDTIETLCYKKAAEIVTGVCEDSGFTTEAMQHGIETEDLAISAYESTTFTHVERVGFVEMDEYIGCSPDGLIDNYGMIEVKCPQPHTHLKYLLLPLTAWSNYLWQVQGAIWVTGKTWIDFVSYCPTFPPDKQLFIDRVYRVCEYQQKLEKGAEHCRQRIKEIVESMNG